MNVPVVDQVWLRVADRVVILHVLELGLACCGIEVREARRLARSAGALGTATTWAATPPDRAASVDAPAPANPSAPVDPPLSVLVVAGTVTTALAPVVRSALDALPEPRAVLAFGACATTGGPYWDSYAVLPGAHEVVPVDAWVAGCPPRPSDLVAGLAEVLDARA